MYCLVLNYLRTFTVGRYNTDESDDEEQPEKQRDDKFPIKESTVSSASTLSS